MDYIKEYRQFTTSYYFSEALRITVGITLPSIIFNFYGLLQIGLIASLGAMAVSAADIPGPIKERRNGMFATLGLIFFISIIVGFSHTQPLLMGFLIAIICFVLSMLGVFNARANAIGFAGILIMVLNLYHKTTGWNVVLDGLFLVCGGLWYIVLSLALFSVRPYKIIQQALGDSIISIGDYFKTRSYFYSEGVDYDKTYKNLMLQQQKVQDKQILLRDMLFKSRNIVKSSTITGRTLLVVFVETVDLFEKSNATFINYETMHKWFDGSSILPHFQQMIGHIVDELYEIGVSIQSGQPSRVSKNLNNELKKLKEHFESFVTTHRNTQNLEAMINMRKIIQSTEDICLSIYTLHHYTRYDKIKVNEYVLSDNYDSFITRTAWNRNMLFENLSLKSNTFRHSLRISVAMVLGYIVAQLFHLEYSHWILLSILVILKPTYSLTKQRNYQRLFGTIIGAFGGIGLLFLITSPNGRFVAMIILMIATYSFMRTRYMISVTFMTAFVLIFFFLLDSKNFATVFESRIIDTMIGSLIALSSTYMFVPSWEKEQIKSYMIVALENSKKYFETVSAAYLGSPATELNYKLSRKDAFVAQANLSGGFSRMMNEPKSKRRDIKKIHQFVVFIFTLNSHIATLSIFSEQLAHKYNSQDFVPIIKNTIWELENTAHVFSKEVTANAADIIDIQPLNKSVNLLLEKRRLEIQQGIMDTETRQTLSELKPIIDQFLFISRVSGDINKLATAFIAI